MTVKQLVERLQNIPQDAIVTMDNTHTFVEGIYYVTHVKYWKEDNTVEIATDHIELRDNMDYVI